MKVRISSSREQEDYEAAVAARAKGFSRLAKFMKVINRRSSSCSSSSNPPPPPPPPPPPLPPLYLNSLLMNRGRLPPPEQSSTITDLSNQEDGLIYMSSGSRSSRRRRIDQSTELLNQEGNQEGDQEQEQEPITSSSSSSIRMYTCKTCGRKFETFQALGGHRASHKMKLVGPGIVGEDGSYQNFQYKAKLHRCSICDKGYQTGQALGGHMRKHRELLENQRSAAAAASNAHHQNVINTAAAANHQSNALSLRWAQMNAAAIFQYSNHAQRYNAPHQEAEAEAQSQSQSGPEEGEILREKVPRKGLNFDLNLDVSENQELGLTNDEW